MFFSLRKQKPLESGEQELAHCVNRFKKCQKLDALDEIEVEIQAFGPRGDWVKKQGFSADVAQLASLHPCIAPVSATRTASDTSQNVPENYSGVPAPPAAAVTLVAVAKSKFKKTKCLFQILVV